MSLKGRHTNFNFPALVSIHVEISAAGCVLSYFRNFFVAISLNLNTITVVSVLLLRIMEESQGSAFLRSELTSFLQSKEITIAESANASSRSTSQYTQPLRNQHLVLYNAYDETQESYYGSQAQYPPPIPYEAPEKPVKSSNAIVERKTGILQVPLNITEHRKRIFHLESMITLSSETYEAVWASVRS